jgi:hypothetical protein
VQKCYLSDGDTVAAKLLADAAECGRPRTGKSWGIEKCPSRLQTLVCRQTMRLLSAPMTIRSLIEDFANQLSSLMERDALDRAREAVEHALGGKRSPGRPPKLTSLAGGLAFGKLRRKGPKQLCPVPGCKNPAAPVFGMVCAKHKDIPKAQIKKYREARRAKKLKKAA